MSNENPSPILGAIYLSMYLGFSSTSFLFTLSLNGEVHAYLKPQINSTGPASWTIPVSSQQHCGET